MSPSTKQRKRKLKVTTDFHAKPFYGSLWQSLDAHHNKAHFETKSPGVPSSPRKKCKNELECDKFFYYHCLLPTKKKERKSLRGAEKRSFSCSARESHWSFICLEMVAEKRTDYLRTTPLPRSLARVGSFWVKFVSMIVYFTIIIRVSTSR